jgi:hypothetical protein
MAVSRKPLVLPFAALAVLAAGWSAYWFVGARVTANGVANWMAREEEHGRRWTCRDQTIGGFPFRFELRCAAVAVDGSQAKQPFLAEAGALRAVALAYRFNHVIAEIDGPAAVTAPTGEQFVATWDSLRASAIVRGGRLEGHDGVAAKLRVAKLDGGGEILLMTADELETHMRPTPGAVDTAFDLAVEGRAVVSRQIDGVLGGAESGDLVLRATVTRADAIGPGAPADNLERWRAAGGKATIAQFRINRGKIALDVAGELSLDDQRKLVGRIEGTAAGLEQFLARGGGVIGGLLNWRAGNDAQRKGLPIALTMKDGRVMMGPVRLGTLAPLY